MTEFALPPRHLLKEEFTTPFPFVERALETEDGFAAAVATVQEMFETGDGRDMIFGFQASRATRRSFIQGDQLRLSVAGVDSFEDLLATASQSRGGVLFDFGDGDELFLAGTRLAALDSDQFSFY